MARMARARPGSMARVVLRSRAAQAAVAVALVVAAAACTDSGTPGAAPSDRPSSPSTGASSPSTTGSAAPTRPAVLPLDDVLPCELVDDAIRRQLVIDRPDAPSATDTDAPVCTLLSSTTGGYVVALERGKGIDALGREVNTSVGGFPAVDLWQPHIRVGHLSIDVGDGQRLDVEVQRLTGDGPENEIHRDTMLLAESVLTALRRRLGR